MELKAAWMGLLVGLIAGLADAREPCGVRNTELKLTPLSVVVNGVVYAQSDAGLFTSDAGDRLELLPITLMAWATADDTCTPTAAELSVTSGEWRDSVLRVSR